MFLATTRPRLDLRLVWGRCACQISVFVRFEDSNKLRLLSDNGPSSFFAFSPNYRTEAVGRLLGSTKPVLMMTDPRYEVHHDPSWREHAGLGRPRQTGTVANDQQDIMPHVDNVAGKSPYPVDRMPLRS